MELENLEHRRVRNLAYQLWKERDSPIGSPEEDWYSAERTLQVTDPASEMPLSFAMGPSEE